MSVVIADPPRRDPRRAHDLTAFAGPMSWDQRVALIHRCFPSGVGLMGPSSPETQGAWKQAFDNDIDLAGRIFREILKVDQSVPGRPGPRPALDTALAELTLDRWQGRDPTARPYSVLPFTQTFAVLAGGRSVRHLARKVDMSHAQVHRLLVGEIPPTGLIMEQIAARFDKSASYFLEYRIGAIAAHLMSALVGTPEQSIRYYEAMWS